MANVYKTHHPGKGHNTEQTFYEIQVMDIETPEEQEMLFEKIKAVVDMYQ